MQVNADTVFKQTAHLDAGLLLQELPAQRALPALLAPDHVTRFSSICNVTLRQQTNEVESRRIL
jgi:hypothetical protein